MGTDARENATKECGAGHVCCEIPEAPPLHDHFLERGDCVACQKIDERAVTGPNPQVDARDIEFAFLAFQRARPDLGVISYTNFKAGWEAALAASDAETSARELLREFVRVWQCEVDPDLGDDSLWVVENMNALCDRARALLTEEQQDR